MIWKDTKEGFHRKSEVRGLRGVCWEVEHKGKLIPGKERKS